MTLVYRSLKIPATKVMGHNVSCAYAFCLPITPEYPDSADSAHYVNRFFVSIKCAEL